MTKIINLIGGPGVGKSTVASGLFSILKQRKISAEYVSEYAKELVWEETQKLLENQIHVFSEQFRRQYRLLNKVEYVVTDSPLLLNSVYFEYYINKLSDENKFFSQEYEKLCRKFFDASFNEFENLTFLLGRNKGYDTNGRNQDHKEACALDCAIIDKIISSKTLYTPLFGNEEQNIQTILNILGE